MNKYTEKMNTYTNTYNTYKLTMYLILIKIQYIKKIKYIRYHSIIVSDN